MCFFLGGIPAAVEDAELGISHEDGQKFGNVNIVGARPVAPEIAAIGRYTTTYLLPLARLLVEHHDLGSHVPIGRSVSPCTHGVGELCQAVFRCVCGELQVETVVIVRAPTEEVQSNRLICCDREVGRSVVGVGGIGSKPAEAIHLRKTRWSGHCGGIRAAVI